MKSERLFKKCPRDIIYMSLFVAAEMILMCFLLLGCERKNLWENNSIANPVTPPVNPPVTPPEEPFSDFRLVSGSTVNGQIEIYWQDPSELDEDGNVEILYTDGSSGRNYTVKPGAETCTIKGLKSSDYKITITVKNSTGPIIAKADFYMTPKSEHEYYFIYSADDLNAIRGSSHDEYKGWDMGDCYNLMNDIDMSGAGNWIQIGDNSTGNDSSRFTGMFEGNNHTISNLTGTSTGDYFGLFGYAAGTVRNLVLMNINITGNNGVGTIAGMNTGIIANCSVTGTSSAAGKEEAGGIAGKNTGTLTALNSSAKVTSEKTTGGIAGECLTGSHISDCHCTGDVSGMTVTGGLIGINKSEIPISNCSYAGKVTGTSDFTGGFAGINEGTLTGCQSSGQVKGVKSTGGLAGKNTGTITSCLSEGSVTGTSDFTGGFAGINEGTLTGCQSSGQVKGVKYTGGLAGKNTGTITSCLSEGGVTGTSDFTGGLVGHNKSIINGTKDSESYASGNVTGTGYVGGLIGWSEGGSVDYSYSAGTVTGSSSMVGGLVGSNDQGKFSNCRAIGESVSGDSYVGGFAGYSSHSEIWAEKCYSKYNVTGASRVGGFVGTNNAGNVINSYSRGNAAGSPGDISGTGGFVGHVNFGDFSFCYSTGLVSGPQFLKGGFCGQNHHGGSFNSCYFNAEVQVSWAAWDDTEKGSPRSTEDMTTYNASNTYILWDFTDIWKIDVSENDKYPYLFR